MIRIFKYMKPKEWMQVAISFVFILISVGLDLKLPDYMSEITTLVQTPGSQFSEIISAGGQMLFCALGSLLSTVIIGYFAARIAAAFSKRLRSLLFDKVDSFSAEEINRFSTASLITRSTNDVNQIQMLVTMGLQLLIKAPIMAVWAVTKIAGKGMEWTWATLLALFIMIAAIAVVMVLVIPRFKKVQTLTDNLNGTMREHLMGLPVVRAYNAEDYQESKFDQVNQELTRNQLFTGRVMAVMMPVMNLVMNGLSLAIYWIGAALIQTAAIEAKLGLFSDMVVFSSYAMQVIMAFVMLVMIFILLPRASVSAKRINEVLDTDITIIDGPVKDGVKGVEGEIEFKKVSFQYPGAVDYVLKDINFTAKKGETVAFIGATGSGKSTLINLIPRFYDVTEGEVLVDGMNVRHYTQEALYNKLGYVPQKSVMFKGTIRSNVAYGDNGKGIYSEEELKRAVEIAQGTEFVEKMQEQYDSAIAQGGTNVSGGQKQRLSIARAVCRKPEIYIFDDSFSALDYKTDRTLRSALKNQSAGVTNLIVAQRIGTIMDADQIIVLDNGQIVGKGKHQELLKSCEVYREIAMSQLSKEELEHE